nr:MAG TPA: hypothetical protein [Caudoviricetes sp.]
MIISICNIIQENDNIIVEIDKIKKSCYYMHNFSACR